MKGVWRIGVVPLRHIGTVEGKHWHSHACHADGQQRSSHKSALQQAHGEYGCYEQGVGEGIFNIQVAMQAHMCKVDRLWLV